MPSICIQSFISFYCRANIESSYGHEVTQIRKQYTPEDKELIKEFLEAKRIFDLESESYGQTFVKRKDFLGKHDQ